MQKSKKLNKYSKRIALMLLFLFCLISPIRSKASNKEVKLMNIRDDSVFLLHFNSYVDPNMAYGIYTNKECNQESWIYTPSRTFYVANENGESNGVDILVYPPIDEVLKIDDAETSANWGNACELYLKIYYDRDSEKVTLLDEPELIILDFNSMSSVANGRLSINNDGLLELNYALPVEATSCTLYDIPLINSNDTVTESGYMGGMKKILDLTASEKKYIFDMPTFIFKDSKGYVICQNNYNIDSLFILPYANNKYGVFSKEILTSEVKSKLPMKLSNGTIAKFKNVVDSLPETVSVQMVDNSVKSYKINYTLIDDSKYRSDGYVLYKYTIPGTMLTGEIKYEPTTNYHGKVENINPDNFSYILSDDTNDDTDAITIYKVSDDDYIKKFYNPNASLIYDKIDVQNLKNLVSIKEISGEYKINPVSLPLLDYSNKDNILLKRLKTFGNIYDYSSNSADDGVNLIDIIERYGNKFNKKYDWEMQILKNNAITNIIEIPKLSKL